MTVLSGGHIEALTKRCEEQSAVQLGNIEALAPVNRICGAEMVRALRISNYIPHEESLSGRVLGSDGRNHQLFGRVSRDFIHGCVDPKPIHLDESHNCSIQWVKKRAARGIP